MKVKFAFRFPFELLFWIGALVALYQITPGASQHMSWCPLHALGINWCPGCGLGRGMALLMHGRWVESWHMHYLSAPALITILYRIGQLLSFEVNHLIVNRKILI